MRCLTRPEPAALALSLFAAHASYNLYSFRDSANDLFLFRQFSPAPYSPPLGGSIADSAVRFTPAVKYGGRENWPSRRETRCMSGHPCRAHHKLKWARKLQSVLVLLYSHLPRSESNKNNSRSKAPLPSNASPPTQTPQGQPGLTGVGNNPLIVTQPSRACRVKDAEGTAKPLVLDSVRWLGSSFLLHTPESFTSKNQQAQPHRHACPFRTLFYFPA